MRAPIAAAAVGSGRQLAVVCDDGTVWLWAPVPPKSETEAQARAMDHALHRPVEHTWVQFHTPIPGTEAYAEYSEEARR